MESTAAIEAFSALAQETRLSVFRRLIQAYPDRIAAGELARALAVPHNTMSTHLAILGRARLISARREGRTIYYGADVDGFRSVVGFLMRDCCSGRAEVCAPLLAELNCGCAPPKKREKVR